jgi:hypothetical protein
MISPILHNSNLFVQYTENILINCVVFNVINMSFMSLNDIKPGFTKIFFIEDGFLLNCCAV